MHTHPEARHLPGLVIYRFDAPLFFANATTFRDEVRRLARADPPPTWIVIAAEPVTDVDTTASDMLEELDEMLNAQGISLVFAELKDPVRRKIERYGLTRTIDPRHFFPTIEAAVAAFRAETGAQWTAAGQPATNGDGARPDDPQYWPASRHPGIAIGLAGSAGSGTIRNPATIVDFHPPMTSCAGTLTRESPAAPLVQPDVQFTCGHADRNRVWIADPLR